MVPEDGSGNEEFVRVAKTIAVWAINEGKSRLGTTLPRVVSKHVSVPRNVSQLSALSASCQPLKDSEMSEMTQNFLQVQYSTMNSAH